MEVDTLILGGGSAGCVLASRLTEDPGREVCLLEAGPDFGPIASGKWPEEIQRAELGPSSFDWGYEASAGKRQIRYPRGRVLGGSSAINATGAVWGLASDYDAWVAKGNPDWGFNDLLPYLGLVENLHGFGAPERGREGMLRVERDEMPSLYLDDLASAYEAAGLRCDVDVSSPFTEGGAGRQTWNASDGVRQHAVTAYLEPVRQRPNLRVISECLIDRIAWRDGCAEAVEVLVDGRREHFRARQIILAAGAIGSPTILQRSGIGHPEDLRPILGSEPAIHALPGVGAGLRDHCSARFAMQAAEGAYARLIAAGHQAMPPRPALAARVKSSPELPAFDLDVLAVNWLRQPASRADEAFHWALFLVAPEARGKVTITDRDPNTPPFIDTGFGCPADVQALARGIEWLRRVVTEPELRHWYHGELLPGSAVIGDALREWVAACMDSYHHSACTCRMGPASDPTAVVDGSGLVHGFSNLYVMDASTMPEIPRAMINLTVYAMAEKFAAGFRRNQSI